MASHNSVWKRHTVDAMQTKKKGQLARCFPCSEPKVCKGMKTFDREPL